jgi:hypothetical protein
MNGFILTAAPHNPCALHLTGLRLSLSLSL